MTSDAVLRALPGGSALLDWFGHVPRFHDANLLAIDLSGTGPSRLRIHTWAMTDRTDARGLFILEKHVVVTLTLHAVTQVALTDFDLPGIVAALEIARSDDGYRVAWESAYGVEGSIRARRARIDIVPGKP